MVRNRNELFSDYLKAEYRTIHSITNTHVGNLYPNHISTNIELPNSELIIISTCLVMNNEESSALVSIAFNEDGWMPVKQLWSKPFESWNQFGYNSYKLAKNKETRLSWCPVELTTADEKFLHDNSILYLHEVFYGR